MDLLCSLGEIDYVVTSEHFGFVGLCATTETQRLGAGVAEKHFGRNLLNKKYMYMYTQKIECNCKLGKKSIVNGTDENT